MLRLLIDESVNQRIVIGLRRRRGDIENLLPTETGLRSWDDPAVLEFAAHDHLVLVTSDVRTMPAFAMERLSGGLSMSGVIVIPQSMALGQAISELELVVETLEPEDMDGVVLFLPL